jgi:hypothetical protein
MIRKRKYGTTIALKMSVSAATKIRLVRLTVFSSIRAIKKRNTPCAAMSFAYDRNLSAILIYTRVPAKSTIRR